MKFACAGLVRLLLFAGNALPQPSGTLRVDVRSDGTPIPDADVIVDGKAHKTAADGTVSILLSPGTATVTVVREPFAPVTSTVTVAAGQVQQVVVDLQRQPTLEEQVTVSATRTDKRLEDQPMRVEVLAREEMKKSS